MEYRRGGSLFSLAFRKREDGAELYRVLSGSGIRPEKLRISTAGDELWLEAEGRPTLVAGHYMNLCGEEPGLPLSWMFRFGRGVPGRRAGRAAGGRGVPGGCGVSGGRGGPGACGVSGGRGGPGACGNLDACEVPGVCGEAGEEDVCCAVLYSGNTGEPDRVELTGAGFFKEVAAYNVGRGCGLKLTAGCRRLGEYAAFVDQVKAGIGLGLGPEKAVSLAAARGRKDHILEDLLEEKGREVRDLILMEYEAETSLVREKKLSYAAGMTAGMLRGEANGMAGLLAEILRGFGPLPPWLEETVAAETCCGTLKKWGLAASRSVSLEEFLIRSGLEKRRPE